jgi:hypothetical protein
MIHVPVAVVKSINDVVGGRVMQELLEDLGTRIGEMRGYL